MKQLELVHFLNEYLNLSNFPDDYSNNGLQLEGPEEIGKVGFAVDAALSTFELAAEQQCDLLIVHHGLSWGAEPRLFTGSTGRRLRFLFERRLGLYAAHLPLDAHAEVGNNAELARFAGLREPEPFGFWHGKALGCAGKAPAGATCRGLADILKRALGGSGTPQLFLPRDGEADRPACQVGIVSGSGGLDALEEAAKKGFDLLITGEMEHVMYHFARENNVAILALGHYRSETCGIKALMEKVEERFQLPAVFLENPTGL